MPNGTEVPWDEGLGGPALEIAGTDESPLRVMAGPGTGKTYALMRRVARLLQEGTPPQRVWVCTFTRTAAADIQEELGRLHVEGADQVQCGTIHSYCFSLLGRVRVLQQTDRVPRPLLDFEIRFLLEDLKAEGFQTVEDCESRLEAFTSAWARLQADEPGWPTDPIDRCFHDRLLAWLQFSNAMHIGELVPEALGFLRDNPASPERRAFDHVLVDEYQDLVIPAESPGTNGVKSS